jgi:hypothetical protein
MMSTFQVKLHTSLAMVAQIRGTNRLQFLPQQACKSECPVIQLTLLEGEIGQYKKNLKIKLKHVNRLKKTCSKIYLFSSV